MNRPLHVLQVLSFDDIGGTELMAADVFPLFKSERVRVEVAFRAAKGPIGQLLESDGIQVHYLGDRIFRRLVGLARSRAYDLVHFYGFRVSALGRVAFRLCSPRTKLIQGIRGLHVAEGGDPRDARTRAILALEVALSHFTHHYIANSTGAVDFLGAHGIASHKLHYVPNGLDVSRWSSRASDVTDEPPVVVCVARFVRRKRHQDLLRALRLVRDRGHPFHCRFVGYGPMLEACRELAGVLELTPEVEFAGRLSREVTAETLRRADLFVLCSEWEGMPVSIMEAMATGLPVVATDVYGIREVVDHGRTGYLVGLGDVAGLANAISRLLADRHLRQTLGAAGRERIREEFPLDGTVRALERLYEDFAGVTRLDH